MSAQTDGAPVGAIHVPLGELLLQRGLITAEQLQAALAEQDRSQRPLGEILIALGFVPAATIAQALATQHGSLLKTEYGYATGFDAEVPAGVAGVPPVTAEPVPPFAPLTAPPPRPPVAVAEAPPPAAPDPAAARAAELEAERDRLEAAVAERDATIERLRSAAEALAERTNRLETVEAELASARGERPEAVSVDAAAFTSRIAELEDALVVEVAGRNELEAAVGERDGRIHRLEELVREQPWASSERHLLFFSGTDGYVLVELDGPPPLPGARVEAPGAAGPQVVTRVAPAPLPGQALPCAYLVAA